MRTAYRLRSAIFSPVVAAMVGCNQQRTVVFGVHWEKAIGKLWSTRRHIKALFKSTFTAFRQASIDTTRFDRSLRLKT
jgi:hypothetical protein